MPPAAPGGGGGWAGEGGGCADAAEGRVVVWVLLVRKVVRRVEELVARRL